MIQQLSWLEQVSPHLWQTIYQGVTSNIKSPLSHFFLCKTQTQAKNANFKIPQSCERGCTSLHRYIGGSSTQKLLIAFHYTIPRVWFTCLAKRGVGALSSVSGFNPTECPCHVYCDSMPLIQIIGRTTMYNRITTSRFEVEHNTLNSTMLPVPRAAHCISYVRLCKDAQY